MQHIPTEQCFGPDFGTAKQHETNLRTDDRRIAHHVGSYGNGPQCKLVPRQQVTGERQEQCEREQDNADYPVEFAWCFVCAMVKNARHVQKHAEHHEVCTPTMHVAHHQTERHRSLQRLNVLPCIGCSWSVEEHQENAGDSKQDKQEEAEAAEAERVTHFYRVSLHFYWVQVIQHRVHDDVRTVTRRVGVALTENRAGTENRVPCLAAE